ncbi:MAG TPA: hypothetical protein VE999_18845 [Gemmataceae bacterium]|nr:hypothetical protein [Gemmataceae bacterium]
MNWRWGRVFLIVAALVGSFSGIRAEESIDLRLAKQYFEEAENLWKQDGGRVWGRPLNGPLLFVDRKARRMVANQADAEGRLRKEGSLFVGELPATLTVANTTIRWAGVRWIMVLWPLPKDTQDRRVLLMHESWHRIQDQLGFPPAGPINAHLDTLNGRYWLQLEWRALGKALAERGENRRAAVEDALLFRAYRHKLCKDAAKEERLLEMHEGLAEYTGVKLSGMSDTDQAAYVVKKLEERPQTMPTFVRSFAYLSGPAYGVLLDSQAADWRKTLKADADLAKTLAVRLPALEAKVLQDRAKRYEGEKLLAAEKERDRERQKLIAEYRARFVDGPVLVLPLQKLQVSFDPRSIQPLEGVGMVYPSLRIVDEWGTLTASKGAVITADFKKVYVTAPKEPKARPLRGEGWEIQLTPGWQVEPGERKGDFRARMGK